jgi:thioredoxin reductase
MKKEHDAGGPPGPHGKKSVSASASAKAPHYDYDTIVVGAGIVGSGIGYQLAQLYKKHVLILEKVEKINFPKNYKISLHCMRNYPSYRANEEGANVGAATYSDQHFRTRHFRTDIADHDL